MKSGPAVDVPHIPYKGGNPALIDFWPDVFNMLVRQSAGLACPRSG